MITVDTIEERNSISNLNLSIKQSDGTWLCYVEGEALPTFPIIQSPEVPESITMPQFRTALVNKGYFNAVQTHIGTLPDTDPKKIFWEYSPIITRNSPSVISIAETVLGLAAKQIDKFFIYAATIQI